MGKRGRTSGAALAVAANRKTNVLPVQPDSRPRVPMSERELHYWRMVMDSPAGEYIMPETYPLLYGYCRSAAESDELSELIDGLKNGDEPLLGSVLRDYSRLCKERERAAKAAADMSVKLRIAPSSRVHKEKAGTVASKPRGQRPWEE